MSWVSFLSVLYLETSRAKIYDRVSKFESQKKLFPHLLFSDHWPLLKVGVGLDKKLILAAKNNGMETFYLISFLMDGQATLQKIHNTFRSVLQTGPSSGGLWVA